MSRESDKHERDMAFGDAVYEAYKRGYNSDLVTRESVDEFWYSTYDRERCVQLEVGRIKPKPEPQQDVDPEFPY